MTRTPYELEITKALYEVYETGFVRIEWRHVLRWFSAKRATKRIYEELAERWEEIDKDGSDKTKGWRLGYITWTVNSAFLTLICLDPEDTEAEKSHFQPLSTLWSS